MNPKKSCPSIVSSKLSIICLVILCILVFPDQHYFQPLTVLQPSLILFTRAPAAATIIFNLQSFFNININPTLKSIVMLFVILLTSLFGLATLTTAGKWFLNMGHGTKLTLHSTSASLKISEWSCCTRSCWSGRERISLEPTCLVTSKEQRQQ